MQLLFITLLSLFVYAAPMDAREGEPSLKRVRLEHPVFRCQACSHEIDTAMGFSMPSWLNDCSCEYVCHPECSKTGAASGCFKCRAAKTSSSQERQSIAHTDSALFDIGVVFDSIAPMAKLDVLSVFPDANCQSHQEIRVNTSRDRTTIELIKGKVFSIARSPHDERSPRYESKAMISIQVCPK